MKLKIGLFFVFAILAGFFFLPRLTLAESVNQFQSKIQINQDSSIAVTETIVYDFGNTAHHGIFRYIPYHYAARGGNYNLHIGVTGVTDDKNAPFPYTVTKDSSNVDIKIGDPNSTVTGVHTYIITYTVTGAINYFSDHDELYWNATGNGWTVPISDAGAQVMLPTQVPVKNLQLACFGGPQGSTTACSGIGYTTSLDGTVNVTSFSQNSLAPSEGLTIVVGIPKGIVHQPTAWERSLQILEDNWVVTLPLFTLMLMFYLWYTKGRDPLGYSTIVAQYEPPASLTPAEVGTLVDESADNSDVSADIIFLATKGYLKITRLQDKILFFNHTDYQLDQLKSGADLQNPFEKKLMDGLFGDKQTVLLSSLKNNFFQDLQEIKKDLYQSLVSKGYFSKNPQTVRAVYASIGFVVLVLGFFVGSKFGLYAGGAVSLSGIIVMVFSKFMPSKTPQGAEAHQYILGLKLYLSVAEKDRLKFFDAPEKSPQQFEKLLPYAMVLKVEKEWAKQFEGIYNQPPSWYYDPTGSAFSTFFLISSLNNFSAATNTTMASSPSSAGSGGSGFGGGGFSGGGFGGGGGGSW